MSSKHQIEHFELTVVAVTEIMMVIVVTAIEDESELAVENKS